MEQSYGTDPSKRYGTGVWNGCGPGACSGPPILTCPQIDGWMRSGSQPSPDSCAGSTSWQALTLSSGNTVILSRS